MSQSLFRHLWRRRSIQLLLVAALLFVIGSAVPPVLISLMRPLAVGQSLTFTTLPNDTVSLMAPVDGSQGIPQPNRDRPECAGGGMPEVPYSCFVVTLPSHQTTALTTSEAADDSEVTVDAVMQVLFGETVATEMHDIVVLDARSTYPVSDPVSQMSISVPNLASGMATDYFVREGLQYFFPFPSSRQSYPWFDMTAQEALLLDYVRETERHGMETYEFHHRFPDLAMDRNSAHAITFSADVNATLDEMAAADFGIPRYAVDRRVWVEPESGTIVDSRTEIHLFFADDSAESTTRAFTPSPDYTIYHTVAEWDAATIAQQTEEAAAVLSTLRALQVFAVVLKTAALIAVLAGVVLLLRERRGR